MAELHYCWRCRMNHHFFDEDEWAEISPLLAPGRRALIAYCNDKKVSMDRAELENINKLPIFLKYKELTGAENSCINSIWHHRRSDFGAPCPSCGKLLRTPRAKLCAECGCQIEGK